MIAVRHSSIALATMAVLVMVLGGCGRTVTRTDPDTVTDLSGYWNDTDARMVADSMVLECLDGAWLIRHPGSGGRGEKPIVLVGRVRNQSSEHINSDIFMNEIERALIESGEVSLVAGARERDEIRQERDEQQLYASPETAAELGRELGADYVMIGTVNSNIDEEGDVRAVYYQVSLELIDVETVEKVWIGNQEIKKIIEW
ncbi:penicillin-binding protein activator LpoB [Candidatus Fermentibacterales bacterium]|nr:penicillin-binding protein activator LpoB [Candidatus Fermentibacterales bacterium]